MIDVFEITKWVIAVSAIVTAIHQWIYKPIMKNRAEHHDIHRRMAERIEKLEEKDSLQDEYIFDSQEQREIMLKSLYGLLYGMREQGLNGEVCKAYDSISNYLSNHPFRKKI